MPRYIISGFNIKPPPGLTPGGKLHHFRQDTVEGFSQMSEQTGAELVEELRARMHAAFNSPDATGRVANSARASVKASNTGVSLQVTLGLFRETQFLTNLGGGRWHSSEYWIRAVNAKFLSFYWRRTRRRFRGKFVRHPGFPQGDIPMEVATEYQRIFAERAAQVVQRGIVELTAGSQARSKFRPVRTTFKR